MALEKLSVFQQRFCLNCEWRRKEVDNIVFCPFANDCPKIKEFYKKEISESEQIS
jgi:hypothetical protein